jgi:hypothetical protein
MQTKIVISKTGAIRFIYNDQLKPLLSQGVASIKRASHVEPEGDKWFADMGPVSGPKLGPFSLRSQALEAERQWLEEHNIPTPSNTQSK